jgi:endonuclease V-like protein UPF0215 family
MDNSTVFHKLGQIEAKIDALMESSKDTEARVTAIEAWQMRAQARIAATVAVLTIGAQIAKEFLSRHTT